MRRVLLIALLVGLVSCQQTPVDSSAVPSALEIRPASTQPQPGWTAIDHGDDGQSLYVDPTPLLTGGDVTSARQTKDHNDRLAVNLKLTDAAGDRMYEYTRQHLNEPLAIMLDGQLLSAPNVQSAIRRDVQITGGSEGLTRAQADAITGTTTTDR